MSYGDDGNVAYVSNQGILHVQTCSVKTLTCELYESDPEVATPACDLRIDSI